MKKYSVCRHLRPPRAGLMLARGRRARRAIRNRVRHPTQIRLEIGTVKMMTGTENLTSLREYVRKEDCENNPCRIGSGGGMDPAEGPASERRQEGRYSWPLAVSETESQSIGAAVPCQTSRFPGLFNRYAGVYEPHQRDAAPALFFFSRRTRSKLCESRR